ncbi:hypothetical protein ACFQV2_27020 [Actinokineospora soli]|uniref:Activator of Hsp90 ATPase homolog 1-like protein n=1 Tax=Actinokineospora soli TaxID=1048753 RepID=A0ABW2TUI0_9PSEU
MGHHFEGTTEFEVPADVDTVWGAIATGPGVQSWFLGHTEIGNGAVRMAMGSTSRSLRSPRGSRASTSPTGSPPDPTAGSWPTSSSSRAARGRARWSGWSPAASSPATAGPTSTRRCSRAARSTPRPCAST